MKLTPEQVATIATLSDTPMDSAAIRKRLALLFGIFGRTARALMLQRFDLSDKKLATDAAMSPRFAKRLVREAQIACNAAEQLQDVAALFESHVVRLLSAVRLRPDAQAIADEVQAEEVARRKA